MEAWLDPARTVAVIDKSSNKIPKMLSEASVEDASSPAFSVAMANTLRKMPNAWKYLDAAALASMKPPFAVLTELPQEPKKKKRKKTKESSISSSEVALSATLDLVRLGPPSLVTSWPWGDLYHLLESSLRDPRSVCLAAEILGEVDGLSCGQKLSLAESAGVGADEYHRAALELFGRQWDQEERVDTLGGKETKVSQRLVVESGVTLARRSKHFLSSIFIFNS